ncbi:MAG: PA14 domain-containing protein [Anaerolineales bacterium]
MGAGGSFTVTFSATPAAPGILENTATVDPDSSIVESNEGNNTGSDTVTAILLAPDFTVSKANDTGGNATVGNLFNWTLTVTNGGTSDGTFADTQTILRDTLPAGPAYGDPAAGNFNLIANSEYISCSIVGVELTCTAVGAAVTIGAGGSFTVTFSATPAAPGVLANTATVDPDSSIVESNEGNNTGSDTVTAISLAPNDDFNDAIPATPLPFLSTFSTVNATTHVEDDPVLSCINPEPLQGAKSVWYSYTAAEFEAITIDTTGSGYNTVIALWRGTRQNLAEVACTEASSLTVGLIAGTTYYIEVAQSGGDTGGILVFSVASAVFRGLRADYFDNITLSGTPAWTRVDPAISFDWTASVPAPGVPAENFSVRWTGRILPQYSETYTFYTYSDDGVRLWVDDQLLIDNWNSHEAEWNTATIALQAGTYYSIRLEYYQLSLAGVIQFLWSSDSVSQQVVPTGALDYLDVVNSTAVSDGAQPTADGVASSTITVTLIDSSGHRVSGIPVYLKASGSGNRINGSIVGPNVWILIGYSDTNGVAAGILASTGVGDKTVDAMAGGMSVGSPLVVTFVAGSVQRISVSHISGREGEEADSDSYFPSVSNDGTRVVFLSSATNLLPNDDTSNPNFFILNTETSLLSPAIFATENGQPNDMVGEPRISGNGQFVVFTSIATNLSASCTNSYSDIFVYEIAEGAPGTFTCISVGLGGAEGNAPSEHPAISDDGRYVVFASTATNLVSGVTDGIKHIYLYDRNTLTMSVVSRNSDEELANGDSDNPSISADGLSIAFESIATNLLGVGEDTNAVSDIFLRNRSGGEVTIRVSVAHTIGQEPDGASTLPSVSSDGERVAFLSNASNLVSGAFGVRNVFLRDIPNASNSLVSVDTTGVGANGNSNFARISSDGLHVIFASSATDLVAGENSGTEQIYLRDFENSQTVKMSKSADGTEGNASSSSAGISGDGTTIAFLSDASNLVAGDSLGLSDIFLTERVAPAAPPVNDDFASAFSAASFPYSNTESTLLATRDIAGDPLLSCGGSPSQHYNSVWYTIQPSVNTRLDLSTAGSDYDTVMAVWTGAPGSLTEVACNDDTVGVQSAINFLAAAGTRYWIEIVQKNAPGGGSLVLSMVEIVPPPVFVYVFDTHGTPDVGLTVQAFIGEVDTGYSAVTNINGEATFNLPESTYSYRFRVVKNGTAFWSRTEDLCIVPGCPDMVIVTTGPVLVTVEDTAHNREAGMEVRVYDSNGYAGYSGITNSSGQIEFELPSGVNYHFRVIKNQSAFWSNVIPNCSVPACSAATITTNVPITITVLNGAGLPEANVWVSAYNENFFTGLSFKTDANGEVRFTLPDGGYRFRVDKLDRGYWSATGNHCIIPASCSDFTINIYTSVVVHVHDTNGNNEVGLPVRAFLGGSSNALAFTDANGNATLQVPNGEYRFRVMKGGTAFWSGETPETPTCSVTAVSPCTDDSVTTNVSIVVHIANGAGLPEANVWVSAYNENFFTGLSFKTDANGDARFTLPDGGYRFRVDKLDRGYWSATGNHCIMPASCSDFTITIYTSVVVHVADTNGNNDVGLPVRAFLGASSVALAYTDANGNATLQVPNGDYRFRAMKGGTAFWSGETPETPTCSVSTCTSDSITTNVPIVVHIVNGAGLPEANVWVSAYNQYLFTGLSFKTDANGDVRFTLPDGDYRFRVDKLDRGYWSNTDNHCFMPSSCSNFTITIYTSVVVHVHDTRDNNDVGLPVRAFLGASSNALAYTDANGNATLQVPNGDYRFRVMKGGTAFWSGATPTTTTCSVTAVSPCTSDSITTNTPVIVTILNGAGLHEANVWVSAYNQNLFTGLSFKTDANGEARFTLPNGNYRFRADKPGRAFWSGTSNHLAVPDPTLNVSFSVGTTVIVHVHDTNDNNEVGLPVRAFVDPNTDILAFTDSNGNATLQLLNGDYRFRVMKGGSAFWSGPAGHFTVPDNTNTTVVTNIPVVVTVLNGSGLPEANVWVHAFDYLIFAGLSIKTDALGHASFTLADGQYRFRADKGNYVYWSGPSNHCIMHTSCAPPTITTEGTGYAFAQDDWDSVFSGVPLGELALTDRWISAQPRLFFI